MRHTKSPPPHSFFTFPLIYSQKRKADYSVYPLPPHSPPQEGNQEEVEQIKKFEASLENTNTVFFNIDLHVIKSAPENPDPTDPSESQKNLEWNLMSNTF